MVIQSNMSSKSIVEVWNCTAVIFEKYNVALTEETIETNVSPGILPELLSELNAAVGSSSVTCIEGG